MHKAKTLEGEWVKGFYVFEQEGGIMAGHTIAHCWKPSRHEDSWAMLVDRIDPSTLCEKVRGKEFFEGDQVNTRVNDYPFTGHLFYAENNHRWAIRDFDGVAYWLSECRDIVPTGKNKHD